MLIADVCAGDPEDCGKCRAKSLLRGWLEKNSLFRQMHLPKSNCDVRVPCTSWYDIFLAGVARCKCAAVFGSFHDMLGACLARGA